MTADSAGVPDGLVEQEAIDLIVDLLGPGASQSGTNCRVVEDHLKQFVRALSARPSPPKVDAIFTIVAAMNAAINYSRYPDEKRAEAPTFIEDRARQCAAVIASTTRGAEDTQAEVREPIEPLDLRLALAESGSCSCGTKTPEAPYHEPRCLYRVLVEAQTTIARLEALNDKYFWQVRDTCMRAEKAEAALQGEGSTS